MKRLRVERWTGQLLLARAGGPSGAAPTSAAPRASAAATCRASLRTLPSYVPVRYQSVAAASLDITYEDAPSTTDIPSTTASSPLPSPRPERALRSAKLAALHARLSLSEKIPLQTLARTLVDSSADDSLRFNNVNLAFLGQTLISYHVSEWLMCHYPRLPMSIIFAANKAFAGTASLHQVARQWGVEAAAEPGEEVDPGLLQFSLLKDRTLVRAWGYERPEAAYIDKFKWRHSISSRVVVDDDFGDKLPVADAAGREDAAADYENGSLPPAKLAEKRAINDEAHASFVRAVIGAVYAHCGREAARSFVGAHVLSRQLDLASLFKFARPTRELARLCAREGFERPVARLLSETGRLSRTPVFVVGIYSGADKLGEGSAASLNAARGKAAMSALKSWYLYSPGVKTRLPSEMLVEGAKPWVPAYVDIGEVI